MTDTPTTDLDVVLSRLDEVHAGLSDTQQGMLHAILTKAAGPVDDEVAGFAIGSKPLARGEVARPSAFKPTFQGYLNGWGQDVI